MFFMQLRRIGIISKKYKCSLLNIIKENSLEVKKFEKVL